MKRKKELLLILLILVTLISILPTTKGVKNIVPTFKIIQSLNTDKIGTIEIKKIQIKEDLYDINSKENTVERHITILKESILPPTKNSIVFLAAHSGTGDIAYFQELDKLRENDEIILTINNKKYEYQVKDIWEEKKNGYINVNKEKENQLILTTCSPTKDNYQLVINCIQKES